MVDFLVVGMVLYDVKTAMNKNTYLGIVLIHEGLGVVTAGPLVMRLAHTMQLTKIMHRHLLTIEPSKLCFLLLAQSTHSETTQVGIALGPKSFKYYHYCRQEQILRELNNTAQLTMPCSN